MIRELIIKACEGNTSKWSSVTPYAFWADRATTHKLTGHSPFYMAYGVEPVLPFDITLATFLVPDITDKLSTANLITTRTRQLQKHEDNLVAIHSNVLKSRFESIHQFEHQFKNTMMRRRRGSTCEYVQRDDLEPRARCSGAPARQAGGAATRVAQPPQPDNPSSTQHTATAHPRRLLGSAPNSVEILSIGGTMDPQQIGVL